MGELKDWIPLISAVIGGLIVYIGQKAVNAANANAIDVKTFRDLIADVANLSTKMTRLEKRSMAYLQYIYALLEYIRHCEGTPPLPPLELESDPELMKVIDEIRNKKAAT